MSLQETVAGIAAALEPVGVAVSDLQVYGYWNDNPTPPSIDVYPGDPFLDGAGFGSRELRAYFTVRARVGTPDSEAAQQLLLRLLDPDDPASVQNALEADGTYVVVPEGVSGYRQYPDDTGGNERLLGVEWRVGAYL